MPSSKVPSQPLVAIVVLNWNGWPDTLDCVASLKRLGYQNALIIVVDNGSSDESEQRIRSVYPDVVLLQTGSNLGYAGGNNVGIEYGLSRSADYVWILNNDTTVEPDALSHLVDRMQKSPEVGLCGSTLIYSHDRNLVQALGGAEYNKWLGLTRHVGQDIAVSDIPQFEQDAVESRLNYIVGASMLVSKQFLVDIGLMCPDYFLYSEELDWAIRAKGRYRLGYSAKSIVYHKEGGSASTSHHDKSRKSRNTDYYQIRSRLLFTRKHYPYAIPTVYLGLLAAVANRIRRGQWDRISMILRLALRGE